MPKRRQKKDGKPRGKTPSLIGASLGRPGVAEVQRKSTCARCGSSVSREDLCFEIPKSGAFTTRLRFCVACYRNILLQTQGDLDQLKEEFERLSTAYGGGSGSS